MNKSLARNSNHRAHDILAFIIPILLTFVQIRYLADRQDLFQTHPLTMMVMLSSLLAHCFAFSLLIRLSGSGTRMYNCCRMAMMVLGFLSVVSLLCLLFIPNCSNLILCILLLLVVMLGLNRLVRRLWQHIRTAQNRGRTCPLLHKDT
ncbi:hypothetical protein ACE6H2_007538 [Prunus campanulata]